MGIFLEERGAKVLSGDRLRVFPIDKSLNGDFNFDDIDIEEIYGKINREVEQKIMDDMLFALDFDTMPRVPNLGEYHECSKFDDILRNILGKG